jgi:hypothetical protein
MTAILFRTIDMRPDFLSSSFDRSILGRRLAQWSQLPDNTAVHQIWHTHQRLVSYLWSSTLRYALHIMHCWIKAQRFHHSQGFLSATEATSGAPRLLVADTFPSHIPGQNTNLVEAFAQYDMQFTERWYDLTRHPPQRILAIAISPRSLPVRSSRASSCSEESTRYYLFLKYKYRSRVVKPHGSLAVRFEKKGVWLGHLATIVVPTNNRRILRGKSKL